MTRVYGTSDDLIEFEGDFTGEVSSYAGSSEDGSMVVLSDGTILDVGYCKKIPGVWGIDVLKKGVLFERIEICTDEDATPYSDVVYLKEGIKWAFVAREWARVD